MTVMKDEVESDEQVPSKARRMSGEDSRDKPTPYIPFIPNFLCKSLNANGKRNVALWRKKVNNGETIIKEDLVSNSNDDKDSDSPSKKPAKEGERWQGSLRYQDTQNWNSG